MSNDLWNCPDGSDFHFNAGNGWYVSFQHYSHSLLVSFERCYNGSRNHNSKKEFAKELRARFPGFPHIKIDPIEHIDYVDGSYGFLANTEFTISNCADIVTALARVKKGLSPVRPADAVRSGTMCIVS
ncbi:MAG: hypothetical protein ACYCOU_02770 [Sulfobacillus sp.]